MIREALGSGAIKASVKSAQISEKDAQPTSLMSNRYYLGNLLRISLMKKMPSKNLHVLLLEYENCIQSYL